MRQIWNRECFTMAAIFPRSQTSRRLVCVYCTAHCPLACRWNVSAVISLAAWERGRGGGGGGGNVLFWAVPFMSTARHCSPTVSVVFWCPAFLSSPQISACACKRDADLLLTPAISSTLLRNALFFLSFFLSFPPPPSFPETVGLERTRLQSNKKRTCDPALLSCMSGNVGPGSVDIIPVMQSA